MKYRSGKDSGSFEVVPMSMLDFFRSWGAFRIWRESGEGSVQAFVLESTRDAARRFFEAAIALIARRFADDLELYNLYSYRDLVDNGVSEDEDLRVFEIGSRGDVVTAWANKPLF